MDISAGPGDTAYRRPTWSVMVPAHNASAHLPATLDSILGQDLPDGSQVVVVDDRSSDDTVQVAKGYADHGVEVVVNDENLGATGNFNRCVELATGDLVHLLHADDEMMPGFVEAMEEGFAHDSVLAAVCRSALVDEHGHLLRVTDSEQATGLWTDARQRFALTNVIRTPAIVVRRRAYEQVGAYRADLQHAADWEMWARLADAGDLWFVDRVLTRYRKHAGADTGRWVASGANLAERARVIDVLATRAVNGGVARPRAALAYSAWYAGRHASKLARAGSWANAMTQAKGAGVCLLGAALGSTAPVHAVFGGDDGLGGDDG